MKKQNLLLILAILISFFIYVFYRTDKIIINQLIISLISLEEYHSIKESVSTFIPLNRIIIYSLPEGLWILWITLISKEFYIEFKTKRMNCGWIPLIYAIGLELIQALHITNGRFDWLDLTFAFIFWLPAYFGFQGNNEKQNIFNPMNPGRLFCLSSYTILYLGDLYQ